MDFSNDSLEQLGQHAHAYYQRGSVANKRANDCATSCGLYLAEAKRRIDAATPYGQRTEAFQVFLRDQCPSIAVKGLARAYHLISVATGNTTVEEAQEKNAAANREYRERKRASVPSRDGIVQQSSLPPPVPTRAKVEAEARAIIKRLTTKQLEDWIRLAPLA